MKNVTSRVFVMGLAVVAMTLNGCKKADKGSTKSLDEFVGLPGADRKTCDAGNVNNLWSGLKDTKSFQNYVTIQASGPQATELEKEVKSMLARLPVDLQEYFFVGNGKIVIRSIEDSNCRPFLRNQSKVVANLACRLDPNPGNMLLGSVIVIAPTREAINKSLIRSFGYFFTDVMLPSPAGQKLLSDFSKQRGGKAISYDLMKEAFLQDVKALGKDKCTLFPTFLPECSSVGAGSKNNKYAKLDVTPQASGAILGKLALAEAIDSAYCSAETLESFKGNFGKTYETSKDFLALEGSKTDKKGGGFNLDEGSGWAPWSYIKRNALSMVQYAGNAFSSGVQYGSNMVSSGAQYAGNAISSGVQYTKDVYSGVTQPSPANYDPTIAGQLPAGTQITPQIQDQMTVLNRTAIQNNNLQSYGTAARNWGDPNELSSFWNYNRSPGTYYDAQTALNSSNYVMGRLANGTEVPIITNQPQGIVTSNPVDSARAQQSSSQLMGPGLSGEFGSHGYDISTADGRAWERQMAIVDNAKGMTNNLGTIDGSEKKINGYMSNDGSAYAMFTGYDNGSYYAFENGRYVQYGENRQPTGLSATWNGTAYDYEQK